MSNDVRRKRRGRKQEDERKDKNTGNTRINEHKRRREGGKREKKNKNKNNKKWFVWLCVCCL